MKRRIVAAALCVVMLMGLCPAAFAAADTVSLSANAEQAMAGKTAAGEAFQTEMESFRAGMETKLKDPGKAKLETLKNNISTIQDKWETVPATETEDYIYDLTANTLTVKTAAGLAWMAQQIDAGSLSGTAVTLADNIDLSGKLWTPAKDFTGTFDGQGHKITGLTINNEIFETEAKFIYLGLFRNIKGADAKRSFVKNTTFENVSVYAPGFKVGNNNKWPSFGTVAGYSDYTDYENITVTGELTLYADGDAAGIVYDSAYDSSRGNSIKNCKVENAAVSASDDFSGITYYAYNAPVVENCAVSGSFFVGDEFAGIAYYAKYGAAIKNCAVSGEVYSENYIYGLCYEVEENEYDEGDGNGQNVISGCTVDLKACAEDDLFGLVYEMEDDTCISNCNVSGTFYAGSNFFGLGEYLYDGGTVKNCSVSGKACSDHGGAAGFDEVYGSDEDKREPATVHDVTVDLTAYYKDGQAGGLIVTTYGNVNISNCTVAGAIYSLFDDNFGGIVSSAENERVKLNNNTWESFGALTVRNCTVSASLWRSYIADSDNGGIIGEASCDDLTVVGCSFTGGLYMATTYRYYAGGLIGDASSCGGTLKVTGSNVTCDVLCVAESTHSINVGGLIGGDSSWSAKQFKLEDCHFKGNLIVKVTDENAMNINRVGALAACLAADNLIVNNCSAEAQILLDASRAGGDSGLYHGGAMFGGIKYPDFAAVTNCTFTGDVTMLGNAENEFDNYHFGMITGEDCAETFQLQNVTVNGDFYSEYAEGTYFGGGIGHRCCDRDLTASNVTINTNITMKNSGSVADVGGFIGNAGGYKLTATDCAYNGDITIEMNPPAEGGSFNYIEQLGGFLGDNVGETTLSHCSHTGNINVSNADVFNFAGFAAYTYASDRIEITDSYTFGDITLTGGKLDSGYGGGQWIGQNSTEDITVKNCYSVGDITVTAQTEDGAYIGNAIGWAYEPITFDNYYHAGTLTVNSTGGTPDVGYLTGNAAELCKLTNVYYDKECFANSTLNGESISLAKGDSSGIFETVFVPLATAQMQANRYESDEAYKALDGSPAVADPHWDYLNGATYADETEKKAPLVDALNAGKDGYLNWRVDGESFRGYPFFGRTYTILYYVDFGSGYELQNIEQFDKTGITAKEIPVPDQEKYPNSAYEWQDQNGAPFTSKTLLNGDKMVYASLISYYTVQYIANYPEGLAITPDDHDILENNYIPGATVTIRSNNTFTVPDGYRFKEWNTKADGSGETVAAFSQQQMEAENLVFYAIWEPIPEPTYAVYYVSNGGNGDMWDATEYHSGNTVTVKENAFVHPDGLVFDGFLEYETQNRYQPGATFEITRDTYLIAQWKAPEQSYTVSYLAGGGEGSMTDTNAYKSGADAVIKANEFTKEGYVFTGFVDLDNNHYTGDGTESISMTKDIVLVAQWAPIKYTVTYHGNGAAEQDVVDSGYLRDTPVTIRSGEFTFTKENSKFLYWSLTADGEKAYDAYDVVKIQDNMDLYAVWEEDQPEQMYSITYKGNGAAEADQVDGDHAAGSMVTIKEGSIFSYAKHSFRYWSLTPDGEKAYNPKDTLTLNENLVLYAIWSKNSSGGGGGGSTAGTLTVVKADAKDKNTLLAGAKYELYNKSGKLLGTYTTDEKGSFTVNNLSSGSYYLTEIAPPAGYSLDKEKHEFTISSGKTTKLELTNQRTGVPDMLNGEDHFAYIIGREDGLVHPEAPITRAEVTTIFFRLLDEQIRNSNLSQKNDFSDIRGDMWCNTAISTMEKLGIVHGRTTEQFEPDAFITRAEFAAIAARFDSTTTERLASFTDIEDHWAAKEISKAAENGWVNGYADNSFKPDQNITRAEAMALINRVLKRNPETDKDLLSDMISWPDNQDTKSWYYLDIQEATNSHDYSRKANESETWSKMTKAPDWKEYEK